MSMYGVDYAPLDCGKKGAAKQSFKEECDVNLVVSRFAETGLLTHVAAGVPQFVDASALGDYRTIIEQVRKVEEYFEGLPALVRSEFDNDAARFMDFLESGASAKDLEDLGIAILGDKRVEKQLQRRRDDAAAAAAAAAAAVAAARPAEKVVEESVEDSGTVST